MLIEITEDDIVEGRPGNGLRCAVARGLNRITNQDWFVTHNCLSPTVGEDYIGDEIPRSVKRFILRFDAGKPVKPFRFNLEGVILARKINCP